jgi:hypothetical protein
MHRSDLTPYENEDRHGRACTAPGHQPHERRTAQRPRVRALRAAIPARSPLLPALTRSHRAASIFPTSPPPTSTGGRGREHSISTHDQQQGDQSGNALGETRNPPGPRKTRPGSRFPPQTPFPASPANHDRPRRANDRGKPLRPPHIPRRTFRLAEAASTGGTRHTTPPTPRAPAHPPSEETTPDTPKGHLKTRKCPYGIGSGSANERFTWPVNRRHASGQNRSTGP